MNTKTTRLRISRFNPAYDTAPAFQEYEVERNDDTSLLAALEHIAKHVDTTLSFRYSCRHSVCGSCAIMVNREPVLACNTFLRDLGDVVTIEPLAGFAVLRDLVVDIDVLFEKIKQVEAHLIELSNNEELAREHRQSREELALIDPYSPCMLCGICYAACPKFLENPEYVGPAALVAAHRYNEDSRDSGTRERIKILAEENGVFNCAANEGCSRACPKNIKNAEAIQQLKVTVLLDKLGILCKICPKKETCTGKNS